MIHAENFAVTITSCNNIIMQCSYPSQVFHQVTFPNWGDTIVPLSIQVGCVTKNTYKGIVYIQGRNTGGKNTYRCV